MPHTTIDQAQVVDHEMRQSRTRFNWILAVAFAVIAILELICLANFWHTPQLWLIFSLLHAAALLCLTALIVRRSVNERREGRHTDLGLALIGWMITAMTGPVGAVAASIMAAAARPPTARGSAILNDWYERLKEPGLGGNAEAVELYRRIISGRALMPEHDATANLVQLMHTGSIKEKQEIIGRVSTHYHPDYLHLLKIGLESAEPPVRIQVATVLAKIRHEEKRKLNDLLAEASVQARSDLPRHTTRYEDERARHDLARRIGETLHSGLLPKADRDQARTAMQRLLAPVAIVVSEISPEPIPFRSRQALSGTEMQHPRLPRQPVESVDSTGKPPADPGR